MFKFNNTLLELNKTDKIKLLKKILALKEEEKLQRQKTYSDNIEQKEDIQDKPQEDIQEVNDKHNNLSIDYLTDNDKDLLQIFFNTIDLNKFNMWDIMTKKYKLIYNILRNGNDLNTDIDNSAMSYSYNDILFIQTLLNYNNYGLYSWEESTSNLKKFIDIVYTVLQPTINIITEPHVQMSSQEQQTNYSDEEDDDAEVYTDGEETDGEDVEDDEEEYTDGEETDGEETDGEETDGEETDGEETDGEETDEEDDEENDDEKDDDDDDDDDDEETEYNRNIYSDYDYDTDSDVESDIHSDIEIYLISESD